MQGKLKQEEIIIKKLVGLNFSLIFDLKTEFFERNNTPDDKMINK